MGQKSQSCLFYLKIGTHVISRFLILVPILVFWISKPKSIFGQIRIEKLKVVQFGWKLAHRVSRRCWFLFRHYFSQFPTLNPFLDKFGSKNSKLFILTKNWHTWYIRDADSYSDNIFFELPTLISSLSKFGLKKSKLFVLSENWHTRTYTHSISKMLILISILVFSNFKPKSIFWTNLSQKTWILHFAWKLVHRVSWGCDCKNTEQGLEKKIKMNNCINCLLLLYLYWSWR